MDHLTEILVGLADHRVRFVVGGGVAAVLHGVERVTMDLDLAIDWDRANVGRFLAAMKALRLQPKMPVRPEVLLEPENLRAMLSEKGALVFSFRDVNDPIRVVDVFIRPELDYETLSQDADAVMLRDRSVLVVSRRRLLSMKQAIRPLRPKDELDIAMLKQMMEQKDD